MVNECCEPRMCPQCAQSMNHVHWDDEEANEAGVMWFCELCHYQEEGYRQRGAYGLNFRTTTTPGEPQP